MLNSLNPRQQHFIRTAAYVYLKYGQYDKAIALLEYQLLSEPKEGSTLKQLAYSHYKKEHYSQALDACQRWIHVHTETAATGIIALPLSDDPLRSHLAIHLLMSLCYMQLNEPALANQTYHTYARLRSRL